MESLDTRIEKAKQDHRELERLLSDYLPFIRKQLTGSVGLGLEFDDMLSLAMLSFTNCILQYRPGKGGFLAFAKTSIRNRLIDEGRKEGRHRQKVVPFERDTEDEEKARRTPEEEISLSRYSRQQEKLRLQEEIASLNDALLPYGVSFGELASVCPRQERSRQQCMQLADRVVCTSSLRESFRQSGRLPQKELAVRGGVSVKTVEKYRKYIVTLIVLLEGDFPCIRAFLPVLKEVRE